MIRSRRLSRQQFRESKYTTADERATEEKAGRGIDGFRIATMSFLLAVLVLFLITPMSVICGDPLAEGEASLPLFFSLIEDVCYQYDFKLLGRKGEMLLSSGMRHDARKVWETMARAKMVPSIDQRPKFGIPGLTARPIWSVEQLPRDQQRAVRALEANTRTIWREARVPLETLLLGKSAASGQLDSNDHHDRLVAEGQWWILRLYFRGKKNLTSCDLVPKTCHIIEGFQDNLSKVGQVKLSLVAPGVRIKPHCGPSNLRLRIHLPINVPGDAFKLRIANESRTWQHGKALVIDDSFEHEIFTPPAIPSRLSINRHRVILIVDFWHPEYSGSSASHHFRNTKALRW